MCDLNCDNLIDLSLDDEVLCSNTENKIELHAKSSEKSSHFVPPSWLNRDSLGNNPFDSVQKLADRLNDPFDIVETEACLKAQQVPKVLTDIMLGNILSLSEDNLANDIRKTSKKNELSIVKLQELDFESPPLALNEKYSTDSISETDSAPNSSAETSGSAKLKKNMEHRKRLLKLSISNSAFSSPAIQKDLNGFDNLLGTPVSSTTFKSAGPEENLLSAESPLKFVEDEDKSSEDPHNIIDLEKKFQNDLDMLRIPILSELPSPVIERTPIKCHESDVNIKPDFLKNAGSNLETIRTKLKAKKSEINKNNRNEISNLIENLKRLISSGEMVNERKKQAVDLLESLTSALIPPNIEESIQNSEIFDVPPQPIIRQGTFDLDIQDNQTNNANKHEFLQEIPRCMVSSSTTYDGETATEKQDLDLPEIASLSPRSSSSPNHDLNDMHDGINNIVEQLSKLLVNHSGDDQTNTNNPTLIVVMNTNQLNSLNIDDYKHNVANIKSQSEFTANYFENSIHKNSPDLTKVNSLPRRRSLSLSIHDKIKVVHLAKQPPARRSMEKQHSIQMDEIPSVTMTPSFNDKEMPEVKTPARLRSNSYSSGTSYATQVGCRNTEFSALNSSTKARNNSRMRKAQILDTHHESQQHAIAKPLSNNLAIFKPDLRKKVKPKVDSILKSSGPLKATVPMKEAIPMLKLSPPSPESNMKSKISRTPTTPVTARVSKLGKGFGYPNACSTPSTFTSPLKRTTDPGNKPRYSYISTTPNHKSSLTNFSSDSLKRRTIAEIKVKSPLKSRPSTSGLKIPSSSTVSTKTSRLSISAGANTSNTQTKAAAKTAAVKRSSCLSSRLSIGGSLLSNRNKENKRF